MPNVLQIQIPLLSVTSITKEKTAKIIPNAVAVSTDEETHTFTSLISRDATFKAMTKAWRKAIARSNLPNAVNNKLLRISILLLSSSRKIFDLPESNFEEKYFCAIRNILNY